MKIFKSLAVCLGFSIALFACSENGYKTIPTPVTTVPNVNQGYTYPNGTNTGYVNGVPVNGQFSNPYLANTTQYYLGLNAQAQFTLQSQALNMSSCAYRNSASFYSYMNTSKSCAFRRQATYTPTQCACTCAPCNCDQVLEQVRTRCFPPEDTAQAPSYIDANGSAGGKVAGTLEFPAPNYISSNPTAPNTIDQNVQTAYLSFRGRDARALYERLAKQEDVVKNQAHSHTRSGVNYKCIMDGKGRNSSDYVCDIDLSLADGKAYQISPVGLNGVSVLNGTEPFHGLSVQIGERGLNPAEAYLKIDGKIAAFIYKKLQIPEVMGTNLDQTFSASVKAGQQVKCFKTSATRAECFIKVQTVTGEAVHF